MPYTFELADWKTLVEGALSATRAGNLIWVVDESLETSGNGLQFRAQKGQTGFTLFGRLRGFSYKMSVGREVEGQPASGEEIKITNQKSAEGVPFDLLFRAVRDQIRQTELEEEERAAVVSLARILESIELGIPLDEEEQDSLVPIVHNEDWDTVIEHLIAATRKGDIKWEYNKFADGTMYGADRGGLSYVLGKELKAEHGFYMWIDVGDGELCITRQWDGSSLERLAEAVGIHTRNTETQFAAMAKAADLEAMLGDISSDS